MSGAELHAGGSNLTAAFRKAQQARVHSSHIGLPAHPSGALPRSGVHPDASGRVLCPHCHKLYPFSAALLNRQLRCSGCRAIFRVAEDRRSFKIAEQEPAPAQAPVKRGTDKAERRAASRSEARLAIQKANSSLNEAAASALRAIGATERPAPPGSATALRAAVPSAAASGTARHQRKKPPAAALTGEGEREGRSRRAVMVMGGIALAVIIIAWLLSSRDDDRQRVLDEFLAGRDWTKAQQAIQAMSPAERIDPLVGLGNATFARPVPFEVPALHERLAGKRFLPAISAWVDSGRISEANSIIDAPRVRGKPIDQIYALLAKAGIEVVRNIDLLALEGDAPPTSRGVITALLRAPDALAKYGIPQAITICPFRGEDGTLLQPNGPSRYPVVFAGRLVRLEGPGWNPTWTVFEVRVATRVN